MTPNDNEISDLFFQNIPEPEHTDSPVNTTQENASSTVTDTAGAVTPISNNSANHAESVANNETTVLSNETTILSNETTVLNPSMFSPENSGVNTEQNNQYESTVIKKKRSRLIPAAGICLLLAVTITAIWYVLSHGDSSKESGAGVSLNTLFDFSSPISEALGAEEIAELLSTQSAKFDSSITLLSVKDTPEAAGLNAKYSAMRDIKNKKAAAELALFYRNASVLSATTYADKNNICLKIPALSSGVFTMDSDNIGTQIKKSPIFTESRDSMDEDTEEIMNSYLKILDSLKIEELFNVLSVKAADVDLISSAINRLDSTYPKDYKKIVDGIKTESIEADSSGNEGTKITIPEESVELFVKDCLTLPLDDKDCQKYMHDYFQILYSITSVTSGVSDDMTFDEFMNQLNSQLRIAMTTAGNSFATFFNQDITITLYKNKKGQLVSLESECTIEVDETPLTIKFNIFSQTPENPTDSMTFQLDLTADGETITCKFINICNRDTEILKHNQTFMFSHEDETLALNFSKSYNTSNNKLYADFKVSADSEDIFEFNTSATCEKSGKEYNFTIHNIDVLVQEKSVFSAIGEVNVAPLTEEIQKPAGTEYRIFEMTKEELTPVMESISENVDSLEKTLSSYGLD